MNLKLKFSQKDRLERLFIVYLLKQGTIKKAWTQPGEVNEVRCISKDIMLGYFLNFANDSEYQGFFDNDGTPMIDYTGKIGVQYNPWYVGHYALAQFERYRLTQDNLYLNKFLTQAKWFLANAVDRVSRDNLHFSVWEYHFNWSKSLISPWISSLSQTYGLSVLLRAYKITNDVKYLEASQRAYRSFLIPIEDGGVLNQTDNKVIFEESAVYPIDTVLNGYIFSIWGVLEYAQATNDQEAYSLYENSIDSLIEMLPSYNLPFWSKYSLTGFLLPPVASVFYHSVHIAQMKALYKITQKNIFSDYAEQWEEDSKIFLNKCYATFLKVGYKIFNS